MESQYRERVFMPMWISDDDNRSLPAMDSNGCNTSPLNPLNQADRVLQLYAHSSRTLARATDPLKESRTLFIYYRRQDSDFTCDRYGHACDQLSKDLQRGPTDIQTYESNFIEKIKTGSFVSTHSLNLVGIWEKGSSHPSLQKMRKR